MGYSVVEMAINQLLAHHGIVFQPESNLVWVSSNPYQMGAFVAYDIKNAFAEFEQGDFSLKGIDSLKVAADPFLETEAYKNYEEYRMEERNLEARIAKENFKKNSPGIRRICSFKSQVLEGISIGGGVLLRAKKICFSFDLF